MAATASAQALPGDSKSAAANDNLRENYKTALATLWQHKLTGGKLSYRQVLELSYKSQEISQWISVKQAWRLQHPHIHFLSDLSAIDRAIPVYWADTPEIDLFGQQISARYHPLEDKIHIWKQARHSTLLHESGHGLQRRALIDEARPDGTPTSRQPAKLAQVNDAKLDYLLSLDEFEVRLQDLNRFHAIHHEGRPILNPKDTITALLALGMPLKYKELTSALSTTKWHLSKEEFHALQLNFAPLNRINRACFSEAVDLVLLRDESLRRNPETWPKVLNAIVLRAPGTL